MRRRKIILGSGAVAATALAGCLGTVGLDEHEATPAGVDPAVREETGYEQTNVEEIVVQETVDAVSEEVTVRNYLTEHEKEIEFGPLGSVRAAAFMVLTSPQISIAGRDFNPIAEMPAEELVGMIGADFEGINNVEKVSEGTVTVLDQETDESVFEGEAELEAGVSVDVNIHISESVETAEDHLVTIGVYPQEVRGTEEGNVAAMMGGVVEEAE